MERRQEGTGGQISWQVAEARELSMWHERLSRLAVPRKCVVITSVQLLADHLEPLNKHRRKRFASFGKVVPD